MSFICRDTEGSHDIVAILENRLTKTIREHFMNRERAAVKSVVVDMNAQYIKFIKALFPNALDLIVKNHPQFEKVYNAHQDVFNALKEKNRERLIDVLENYRHSGHNMDTAISTWKKNMTAVLNSVEYDFSNGPVEGINRRLKSLKRSCFGFRRLDTFRNLIALTRSCRWKYF